MFKGLRHLLICCPLLMGAASALASDDDDDEDMLDLYGDEEFLSIATGATQLISKAPAVASILTADDIENLGAVDLDDALQSIPGLHVSRSPFGYAPIYIFRGIYAFYNPQVLMLINGVPITNLFHGDRNLIWGGMPVKSISRIEVIRGPGSAIYGADAFSGVINIITKSAKDIKTSGFGIRAGSFDTYGAWAQTAVEYLGVNFSTVVEFGDSNGAASMVTQDAQSGLDTVFGTNASLAPGNTSESRENVDVRFNAQIDRLEFRAGLQFRSDIGSGAGVANALDPVNRYRSRRINTDLTWTNDDWVDKSEFKFGLSVYSTTQEIEEPLIIFPPGTDIAFGELPDGLIGNPEVFERHSRASVSFTSSIFEGHQIRSDIGYYYGDLYEVRETKNFGLDPLTGSPLPAGSGLVDVTDTPFVFLEEGNRKNAYIFVQDTWNVATDWAVTTGVRYDDYSDFGDTINPRFALVWSTSLELTTKLLYGEAFRAPSFAQQRAINNPVILGNPNLEPESLRSLELAFDYRVADKYRLGLNLFQYDWDDIIQFVQDTGGDTSTAQNSGKQSGKGFELEFEWDVLNNLTLQGDIAYQDSTDETTNTASANAPQRQMSLSLFWDINDSFKFSSQFYYVAKRLREPGDTRAPVDDFVKTNLGLKYTPYLTNWYSALMVHNALDEDIREPASITLFNDLPMPERSYYLELGYQL